MTRSPLILVRPQIVVEKEQSEALQKKAIENIRSVPALIGLGLGAVFIILHWAILKVVSLFKLVFKPFSKTLVFGNKTSLQNIRGHQL